MRVLRKCHQFQGNDGQALPWLTGGSYTPPPEIRFPPFGRSTLIDKRLQFIFNIAGNIYTRERKRKLQGKEA
ncbi:hypothetical protein AFLA_001327 [Aspergillus flavus NRRL3357]|nr:hypothetical protein AFLA_001327 [Aspergillus flavus NRRL3357]